MTFVRNVTFAACVALAGPASAAVVVNGSFEQDPGTIGLYGNTFGSLATPGEPSWDIFTSLPGWTTKAGDGIEVQTAETIPLAPQDGNHYIELDGNQNSSISQTIALGVGHYLLSFWYSPRQTSTTTNEISFGVSTLFLGGVNGPSAQYPIGVWTEVVREFVVTTAGNYNLFFDASSESDSYGGFIDNVQVASVPLPAGGLLLIGAIGGLAALRRRKTVTA